MQIAMSARILFWRYVVLPIRRPEIRATLKPPVRGELSAKSAREVIVRVVL
jgi:hypothetical protein